jgi:hypothetical protein
VALLWNGSRHFAGERNIARRRSINARQASIAATSLRKRILGPAQREGEEQSATSDEAPGS